jgi:hypothetical protein
LCAVPKLFLFARTKVVRDSEKPPKNTPYLFLRLSLIR